MKKREYRITEYLGVFNIEIKSCKTKGFFKKKTVCEWVAINTYGHELFLVDYKGVSVPMHPFYSLYDAKIKLEQIKKGVIIHN